MAFDWLAPLADMPLSEITREFVCDLRDKAHTKKSDVSRIMFFPFFLSCSRMEWSMVWLMKIRPQE